ncbi:hypothetical protein OPS25_01180 [Alteromonas ponticola]|uniref:Peptidase M15 n=1 Tax=Alteromonas aquimaris TaxID=2998417 RepID=A0ABT3P3J1_9ALTE|nr:hypothetical protein [Alteromonas aquimaris]MCW8107115.1 hypothetical protein [Alteromonas aquimaris]
MKNIQVSDIKTIRRLNQRVIDWHASKYPNVSCNEPSNKSLQAITDLSSAILVPIEKQYGAFCITYGFTSAILLREIKKKNPRGIAPSLDQHAAHELNSEGNFFCNRLGAACDFIVESHASKMDQVANWVSQNLSFDRMYFYGVDRPLHVSFGPELNQFIQIMEITSDGRRYPGKKGAGITFDKVWI